MATCNVENSTPTLFYSSLKSLKAAIRAKRKAVCGSQAPDNQLIQYLNILRAELKDYGERKREHSIDDFYKITISFHRLYGDSRQKAVSKFKESHESYERNENAFRSYIAKHQSKKPKDFDRDDDSTLLYSINQLITLIREMEWKAEDAKEYYEFLVEQYIVTQVLLKGIEVLETIDFPDCYEEYKKENEDMIQETYAIWDKFCENYLGKKILDIKQ